MLINHDQNMLCLDEFDILELREKCRWVWLNGVTEAINGCIKAIARDGKGYSFEILRGKVLYGQAYKTKAIFSYNKFSPKIHYVTDPSNRLSLNMIQNLMDSYKQISGADIDRLKLGLFWIE